MPVTTIADDKRALDLLSDNTIPEELRAETMSKLGVSDEDVKAWSLVKDKKDKQSINVKNAIYEKIAEYKPIEDPETFTGMQAVRFMAKNFIDQDVKTQKKFFNKLGYQAQSDTYGNLYVIDKDRNRRIAIDTKGMDLWDITDVFTDILEGVGVSAAVSAGVLGGISVGAPLGAPLGPLGSLATGAIGGVTGGLLGAAGAGAAAEGARQTSAFLAGAREEYDPERIIENAKFTALFAPLEILGKGVKAKGKRVAKETTESQIEKATAEKIKAAAKVLGVDPTPGMLKKSKEIQALESSLLKSEGKIGGRNLRKQAEKNKNQIESLMSDFIEPNTAMTTAQAGEKFGENIADTVATRLTPAIEIYNKYDDLFKYTKLPETDGMGWLKKNTIMDVAAMESRVSGDPKGQAIVDNIIDRIENIDNINDISVLKRNIADEAARNREEPIWQFINQSFGPRLRELRIDAIKDVAKDPIAAKELTQADAIYAETAKQVQNLINAKKLKPGVRSALSDWLDRVPEIRRIEKIIDTKDPKRIAKVAKDFPESFEYLREGFKRNFQKDVENSMRQEGLNVTKLAKKLDKLPDETIAVLYGENGKQIVDALKTYLKSLPENINPSNTGGYLQFLNRFSLTGYPIEQIRSVWQELRLNRLSKNDKNFYESIGEFINRLAKTSTPSLIPATRMEKSGIVPENEQYMSPLIPRR